ncbi:PepSY domain-containing protein [Bacillus manliponensis]|uniref:PepSY domain-containing protein n=1 Tax=Bacillus manliponensis TaxID=574376 RepID=UPI00351274AC
MNKTIITGMTCLASVGLLAACDNDAAADISKETYKISVHEAIEIFEEKHPNAAITSINFDKDFGKYRYDIEGVDDSKEYEISVDATSKDIKEKEEKLDREDANGQKKRNEALNLEKIITPQEAMQAALIEMNNKGNAVEWSMEQELQNTYYSVQVKDGRTETEVNVSAADGKILSVEAD